MSRDVAAFIKKCLTEKKTKVPVRQMGFGKMSSGEMTWERCVALGQAFVLTFFTLYSYFA